MKLEPTHAVKKYVNEKAIKPSMRLVEVSSFPILSISARQFDVVITDGWMIYRTRSGDIIPVLSSVWNRRIANVTFTGRGNIVAYGDYRSWYIDDDDVRLRVRRVPYLYATSNYYGRVVCKFGMMLACIVVPGGSGWLRREVIVTRAFPYKGGVVFADGSIRVYDIDIATGVIETFTARYPVISVSKAGAKPLICAVTDDWQVRVFRGKHWGAEDRVRNPDIHFRSGGSLCTCATRSGLIFCGGDHIRFTRGSLADRIWCTVEIPALARCCTVSRDSVWFGLENGCVLSIDIEEAWRHVDSL